MQGGPVPWSLTVCRKRVPHHCSPGGHLGILPGRCTAPTRISYPVFQCFIKISAAYGSTKDISVYSVLGLPPSQIFIVGRPTKKYQTQCQVGGSGGVGPVKAERGRRWFIPLFVHSATCSFFHLLIHSFNKHSWVPVWGVGGLRCHVIQSRWGDGKTSR